jgi:hypothetical protein
MRDVGLLSVGKLRVSAGNFTAARGFQLPGYCHHGAKQVSLQ